MKLGKPMYRGTIVVDIDGVLADFEREFCDAFGYHNRHLYALEARYPDVDPMLIREFVTDPENYKELNPIFGGLLFCRQAHARGWYILLMTARDRALRDVTKNWLAKYGVVYNELMFSKNKAEAISDYDFINPSRKVKMVIDDSVSVMDSLLGEKFGALWDQPWNRGVWTNPPYARMWYDEEKMKVMLLQNSGECWGVWDIVEDDNES